VSSSLVAWMNRPVRRHVDGSDRGSHRFTYDESMARVPDAARDCRWSLCPSRRRSRFAGPPWAKLLRQHCCRRDKREDAGSGWDGRFKTRSIERLDAPRGAIGRRLRRRRAGASRRDGRPSGLWDRIEQRAPERGASGPTSCASFLVPSESGCWGRHSGRRSFFAFPLPGAQGEDSAAAQKNGRMGITRTAPRRQTQCPQSCPSAFGRRLHDAMDLGNSVENEWLVRAESLPPGDSRRARRGFWGVGAF
jgi:hypothetical protein